MPRFLSFSLPRLKVNIRLRSMSSSPRSDERRTHLPDNLWHVQVLLHSKFKDGSNTLKVFYGAFHLSPLDPSRTQRWIVLEQIRTKHHSTLSSQTLTVKNFSYSVLTRSNSRNRISNSMYPENSLGLGHMPIPAPSTLRAAETSKRRISK